MSESKSVPVLSPAAATTTNPEPRATVADSPDARATQGATDVEADFARTDDEREPPAGRYELRDRLGEGGMGEVHLCADHRIGRDIAMKVILPARNASPDARRRFLREARVQGQLEHPSIVPVYDVGRDADGSAFFTMRRVRGKTLEQVLDEVRAGDLVATREWTRHKLLTAFGQVCLAIDFAHSRGVLHRDLKPDNVMLGDFGEVYVLDWGLAKAMDDARVGPRSERDHAVTPDPRVDDVPRTAYGQVMGTPGYMAPEQLDGDADALDVRTDVYALGAILFEILTCEPLHGRGSMKEILAATRAGTTDPRASSRAPALDIAPELDSICVRACAHRREDRFPRARDLYEAVESFLAGDRDVVRRRELARGHARAAGEALERALHGEGDPSDQRSRAMREVSRAVALDPSNADAMETLVRLFIEVPRELPHEAREELSRALVHSQKAAARTAALGYLSWLLFAPLGLWMGARDLPWGFTCDVLFLLAAASSWYIARCPDGRTLRATDIALFASTVALVAAVGVCGPFMLLPGVAAVNTILYVATADRSRRTIAIASGCLAVALPVVLELAGLFPAALSFDHGALVTLPQILTFPRLQSIVFLLATNLTVIVVASLFVGRFRDALQVTQERLTFHTWQLRQFVPGEARGAMTSPSTSPPRAP